jgi:hypothetical protein
MRSLALAFLFTASAVAASATGDVGFVRVWSTWRSAESFERISEYFTGKENTGREVVLRTHPEDRAGFYYLVRVANRGSAISAATFALQVVAPDSAVAKSYTFPVSVPPRETVYELGLTGTDWAGKDVHPVAWKLDLLSSDGKVLSTEQSFLWEMPKK